MTEAGSRPPALDVAGQRVLVTGHTGFKGAWLVEWLLQMGARVTGIALPPDHDGSLFELLRHGERMDHLVADVRDAGALAAAVRRAEPQLVFHLAAQALVLRSYREPLLTWETNVTGTLNVLEAVRALKCPVTVVAVTTDKVYRNREWEHAYREEDELGGHDPYSASKAACELAVASWRSSFGGPDGVTVVTARAGNVVGAGDQSADRIVPDCFRAWARGEMVQLRHPTATRPWQHVLEPLNGYLALAAHARSAPSPMPTCNFGPEPASVRPVEALVRLLAQDDPRRRWARAHDATPHEAHALALAIDRARLRLGWTPRLSFEETADWTSEGYTTPSRGLPALLARQIADYDARRGAAATGLAVPH
ncbi:MAG: CDP-glucose 4,6-dehydratase [Gemmatimonadaceae bacterium]